MTDNENRESNGSATGSGADANNTALTEREVKILTHAWSCLKSQPEVDFKRLAVLLDMTNHNSAVNAWGRIKKKLWSDLPAAGPKTPASGRKRKTAAAAADGENGDETDGTPTKKSRSAKKTPRKPATKKGGKTEAAKTEAVKAEAVKAEDDDDADMKNVTAAATDDDAGAA